MIFYVIAMDLYEHFFGVFWGEGGKNVASLTQSQQQSIGKLLKQSLFMIGA